MSTIWAGWTPHAQTDGDFVRLYLIQRRKICLQFAVVRTAGSLECKSRAGKSQSIYDML